MAITRPGRLKFMFQNSNGVFYELNFVLATGVGVARKHGLTIKSTPMYAASETAVTVDAASLAAWKTRHVSHAIHAAVYNTAQSLNTILNAAS